MKKIYSKPTTRVYKLQYSTPLLIVSNFDGDNPLEWGNPLFDR